ncbi:hypothetical protein BJ165DRAFT_1478477 [Panaeolus papilionaceus]|nr:hypothetical protein BJ165DRAFT_1478477 [Panaeolus papilionaceus]
MKLITPSDLVPGLSGRWSKVNSSDPSSTTRYTISASWASASLSFCFTGSHLHLRVGENTERKDKINGGTKMITILKARDGGDETSVLLDREGWTAVDPQPGSNLTIHDDGFVDSMWIKIMLTDWASTFELEGLSVDDNATIHFAQEKSTSIPKILLIGDSISLAFASPGGPRGEAVPFGVLDAFPFVAQRKLLQAAVPTRVEVKLCSYPGWLLVSPNADDIKDKFPAIGMSEGFFWDTPRSKEESPHGTQSVEADVVIFAIGTNDQFFEISPNRFHDTLRDLTAKLLRMSPSLSQVWLVPPFPDCDTDNTELVNAVPIIAQTLQGEFGEIGVKLCDLVKGLGDKDTMDGVHLTLQTHNVLGEKLAKFIEANLP